MRYGLRTSRTVSRLCLKSTGGGALQLACDLCLSGELQLFALMFVDMGGEVGAAAGFIQTGGADDDQLLTRSKALGVDGALAADHADGGELGDLVGEGHKVGDGAEGFVGKGGVEAGEQDTLAERDELKRERDDGGVKELGFVDANDVDLLELRSELGAEVFDGRDNRGVVGLRAVAGDGGAVIAEIDVGFITSHALFGDTSTLEAADELLTLARKHGAGDDFEDSGRGAGVRGGHGVGTE